MKNSWLKILPFRKLHFCASLTLLFINGLFAQCTVEQATYNGWTTNGLTWHIGQSFLACGAGTLDYVMVKIIRVGSQTGTSSFRIDFHEGDNDDWSAILWSSQVYTMPAGCSGCQYTFNVDMSLGSGISRTVVENNAYRIRVVGLGGTGNSNHNVRMHTQNPYPNGIKYNGSLGPEPQQDMYFRVAISTAFPVELTSFEARATETSQRQTILTFSNASHFVIEHSTDGKEFQEIGSLSAHGTTTEPHSYEFTHEEPAPGNNYYRLRMEDYDGSFKYSSVEVVHLGEEGGLRILPNPVQNDFTVLLDEPTEGSLQASLFDLSGNALYQAVYDAETTDFTVPTSSLQTGIYHLKLVDGLGRVQWRKVVKAD